MLIVPKPCKPVTWIPDDQYCYLCHINYVSRSNPHLCIANATDMRPCVLLL